MKTTYKTNRFRLPLLDFVGVTPTGKIFSADFAYMEGERILLRRDVLPGVIVTDRDLTLMNAMKTVFPECTNLLCNFHINKNFDECLKKFEMVCSLWPMFVDYVKETWIISHKEKFVSAWMNKVMHLGNTTTNRVESTHWALKRVLQNSLGDLCIHMSLDMSSKKPYTERLLEMISRYALNQIAAEFERVHYAGKNPSTCGCVMRSTHGLPCACELSKYVDGCIPLDSIHMFWRRLSFSDQGLSKPEVSIKEEMETISKRFEELDVCGKFTLKTKLREIAYIDQNLMCPPPTKVNTKETINRNPRSTKRDPSYWEYVDAFHSVQNSNSSVRRSASSSEHPNPRTIMPMLDQFFPFIHDFIHNIVDVKTDGNYGYQLVASLLGMGENSWSLVRTHLLKEHGKFSDEYMKLFGDKERFEELRMSILVDGLTKVTMDKWMDIIDMGYVYLKDRCPLPPVALLWSSSCHPQAKQMQHYKSFMMFKRDYSFTDTGNHLHFQCMQLKNDDDVNTMLMCNNQFSCVGPIELLCTIGRTPYGILNLLEASMTPTHDALLYYNVR
ncbi:hypothetical protein HKD37_03G007636 [Glycine soja]